MTENENEFCETNFIKQNSLEMFRFGKICCKNLIFILNNSYSKF